MPKKPIPPELIREFEEIQQQGELIKQTFDWLNGEYIKVGADFDVELLLDFTPETEYKFIRLEKRADELDRLFEQEEKTGEIHLKRMEALIKKLENHEK